MWLERKVFAEFLTFAYTYKRQGVRCSMKPGYVVPRPRPVIKALEDHFCSIWSELKFCIMSMIAWCGQEISKSYCSRQHNFIGVWAEAEFRYVVSAWSEYTVLMTSLAKLIVGGHNYTLRWRTTNLNPFNFKYLEWLSYRVTCENIVLPRIHRAILEWNFYVIK